MTSELPDATTVAEYVAARTAMRPEVAIVLGSGLGGLTDEVEVDAAFPYADIPGFPVSTVPGHAGRLVLGHLGGRPVLVMQGRFHFYEGYPMRQVIFPVRVIAALGASRFVVTNAAGGLNRDFEAGDVMLITDQINLMGTNPLIGPNDDAIGPRFPDVTHAYAPELRRLAIAAAAEEGIKLQQGVYVAVTGPSFETPAERRFLRLIGADAVGMSTVPEVIAANHAGLKVLGLSAITNKATGDEDQEPDSHEEVLVVARVAGEKLVRIVRRVIPRL